MRSIRRCVQAQVIFIILALLIAPLVGTAAAQTLPPPSALNGLLSGPLTATDSSGNIYAAGTTNAASLPVSPGAVQAAYAGGVCQAAGFGGIGPTTFPCFDLYIVKLDPTGTQLLAATYLGGRGNELLSSLTVDSQGAVYLAGTSDAVNFLPQSGTPVTGFSGFVAKLSTNLDKVNYGVALPASKIALDSTGNLWALGTAVSTPPVSILSEVAPSGQIALSEQITDMSYVSAIALDSTGNSVVVGQSGKAVLVIRFRATGARIGTASFGNGNYFTTAAAVAPNGSVYIAGTVIGSGTPTDPPGGFFAHVATDGAVQKLSIGQTVQYLIVGSDSKAFVVGNASAGIPTSADALQRCRTGSNPNVFVAGWDGVSAAPFYATYAGPQSSFPSMVALNSSGVLTLTGPLFSAQGPVLTHLQPGVSASQPACLDPLPANLANSGSFPALNPATAPAAIAAGEYAVFFGSGIGPSVPAQWDPSGSVPTELAGVQLLIGGHPAPLLSVSANQITAIMPLALPGTGTADVVVVSGGATVATAQVPLTAATPAIFGAGALSGTGDVFNEDFSLNSQINTAAPGNVITVFVSGGGALTPSPLDGSIVPPAALPLAMVPITAYIEGSGAQVVTFAGQAADAAAGLMQVNVRIGYDFAFHGQQHLVISFGSQQAQATFWVK